MYLSRSGKEGAGATPRRGRKLHAPGALALLVIVAACKGGAGDIATQPPDLDVPEECGAYADMMAKCFFSPRLASQTRLAFNVKHKSREEVERTREVCRGNLAQMQRSCR